MRKRLSLIVILISFVPFSVLAATMPTIAFEQSNTIMVTAGPAKEMTHRNNTHEHENVIPYQRKGIQQLIYDRGYNYTVAENRVTQLSYEDRKALCGYKPITAPEENVSENVMFFSCLPKAKKAKLKAVETESQPSSSYDAMALGYVTPVKNQGACGSCWLFAATAEFESMTLKNEGVEFDFSEQELGDCNIWSTAGGYDFCDGGNAFMTANYFTKHGSATETCHPYAATQKTCYNCAALKTVNNWRMITGAEGESQIDTIKNAIQNYGPVYSTIYASDPGFRGYSGGVYEYWDPEAVNHAIEIIGWDDTLPHTHGTGAWLVKNSWGTSWGASGPYPGCAWVAYGAANIGDYTTAIASYEDSEGVIFYHDECGWMGYQYGGWGPTAYGAVRFTPLQDLTLTAVDFWAVDSNMEYELKIFDTFNADSSSYSFSVQRGTTQTGTIDEIGYYSILLDTPVQLVSENDFIVQVRLTSTESDYPLPIDYYDTSWLPAWSEIATFSGESYYSADGSQFYSTSFYDIGIRARAVNATNPCNKGDFNCNGISADADDLAMMVDAAVGKYVPEQKYDLNNNCIFADVSDLEMMKDASEDKIELM